MVVQGRVSGFKQQSTVHAALWHSVVWTIQKMDQSSPVPSPACFRFQEGYPERDGGQSPEILVSNLGYLKSSQYQNFPCTVMRRGDGDISKL